jgi:UDP-glucose 4-epimerase
VIDPKLRIVVTGARGKVGARVASLAHVAGHDVIATDLERPVYDSPAASEPRYVQADLSRLGDALSVIDNADVVIHAAAIPEPSKNVGATVFSTNAIMSWNVIEAVVRGGAKRIVNVSSDSVAGMTWAHRPFVAEFCPIDESLPDRPQDAYGLSKLVSEQLCDGLVRRSDATAVSVRPTWVQTPETYAINLAPFIRDSTLTTGVFWSYIDVDDLADLLLAAAQARTPQHEIVYAAAADNIGGRDLARAVREHFPGVVVNPLERPDASGISSARARTLFGWRAQRSWRDYLSEDGSPLA